MIDFKTDSVGDTFSKKYGQYVNSHILLEDTLEQLEKNFEDSFGYEPSRNDMEKALGFISMFFAEIGETCSKTRKAQAASELSYLVDADDPIETARRIADYRTA